MNTFNARSTGLRISTSGHRAQFSPLFRRVTQDALTRNRVAAQFGYARSSTLTLPDPLTPATPSLVERWWDPHLVDRLQAPLTRFRD